MPHASQEQLLDRAQRLDRAYKDLGRGFRPARKMRRRYRGSLRRGCTASELQDWCVQYNRLHGLAQRKRGGKVKGVGFDPIWDSPDNMARLQIFDRRVSDLDVAIQNKDPEWLQSWFRFRNGWREFYNRRMADSGAGARDGLNRYDLEIRMWRAKAKDAGVRPPDPDYPDEPQEEPTISLTQITTGAVIGALLLGYLLTRTRR